MDYNFFAYMNRMKYIERWSLMRSTVKENIMEHSQQVAVIAHALAVINNVVFGGNVDIGKVALRAMFHEASEVITGDLPTPIKYYNADINSAYKNLEAIAEKKLLNMLPEKLKPYYEELFNETNERILTLVKAADKISAYIKCIEEVRFGNKEFLKAKETIYNQLSAYCLPEVEYFMDNFIHTFEKTLDELD